MSESDGPEYQWDANDFANIITISGACLASVLLVLFKSRCKKVTVCCGVWSCDRELPENREDPEGILTHP
jgi:hypothetical protein